jgi:hypothetical protein
MNFKKQNTILVSQLSIVRVMVMQFCLKLTNLINFLKLSFIVTVACALLPPSNHICHCSIKTLLCSPLL